MLKIVLLLLFVGPLLLIQRYMTQIVIVLVLGAVYFFYKNDVIIEPKVASTAEAPATSEEKTVLQNIEQWLIDHTPKK